MVAEAPGWKEEKRPMKKRELPDEPEGRGDTRLGAWQCFYGKADFWKFPPHTHTHNFRFFGLVRTSLYDFTWPQGKLVIYFIAKRFNWKQNQSATKEQGRFVAGRQRM